jgi:hypothetical protein
LVASVKWKNGTDRQMKKGPRRPSPLGRGVKINIASKYYVVVLCTSKYYGRNRKFVQRTDGRSERTELIGNESSIINHTQVRSQSRASQVFGRERDPKYIIAPFRT